MPTGAGGGTATARPGAADLTGAGFGFAGTGRLGFAALVAVGAGTAFLTGACAGTEAFAGCAAAGFRAGSIGKSCAETAPEKITRLALTKYNTDFSQR